MTSATRHFTSDNKSRSKKGFFFTWDYSSDGRSSPADTGDDDEAKAFVFQPGDAHVIGVANVVALSVAFWGRKWVRNRAGTCWNSGHSPRDIFSARANSGGRAPVAELVWQSSPGRMKLEKARVSGWWAVQDTALEALSFPRRVTIEPCHPNPPPHMLSYAALCTITKTMAAIGAIIPHTDQ